MAGSRRPGRGERARVAARVRAVADGRDRSGAGRASIAGASPVETSIADTVTPGAWFADAATAGASFGETAAAGGEFTDTATGVAPPWLPSDDLGVRSPEPVGAEPVGPEPSPRAWTATFPSSVVDTLRARHGPVPDVAVRRWRWAPGSRGVTALAVALALVVGATGWWLAAQRPTEVPVTAAVDRSGTPLTAATTNAPSGTGTGGPPGALPSVLPGALTGGPPRAGPPGSVPPTASPPVVVDVAGRVRRPGLYELPPGSRVYDAVRAAGGARAGVNTVSLNLAEPVHDGQQIVVGRAGAAPGSGVTVPGEEAGATPGADPVVDINTASLDLLETLPGVGPVLGQNILDWRNQHGGFTSIDQLGEVYGIGDTRLAQLRPLVRV